MTDIKSEPEVPKQEEELEEISEIIYEEEMSWGEAIQCAFACMSAIDGVDFGMLTPADQNRLMRIRRKSIRLLDVGISEVYNEKIVNNNTDEE